MHAKNYRIKKKSKAMFCSVPTVNKMKIRYSKKDSNVTEWEKCRRYVHFYKVLYIPLTSICFVAPHLFLFIFFNRQTHPLGEIIF